MCANRMTRKGMFFTMDAIMAAMLMIGGLLLLNEIGTFKPETEQIALYADDIIVGMQTVKITELNSTFIADEIASGNITSIDNSVLEQVGEYWALNETEKARELITIFLGNLTVQGYGINISLYDPDVNSNQNVYNLSVPGLQERLSSRRMISGIKQINPNESLKGSTASAFVKKASNKKTSAYAYFGGFIGQGNISVMLRDLPSDVNTNDSNDVVEIVLETAAGMPFNLTVNGDICNRTNLSFTGDPWWNESWQERQKVFMNETLGLGRTDTVIAVNVTGLNGSIVSCSEVRMVRTADLTLRPYMLIDGDDTTYCYLYVNASVSADAENESNYYVYYNNPSAASPNYGYFGYTTIFFDDFNDGVLDGWTADSGWDVDNDNPLPSSFNDHAHVDGNVNFANLTPSSTFDFSGYGVVNLSFYWMIDADWDVTDQLFLLLTNDSSIWLLQDDLRGTVLERNILFNPSFILDPRYLVNGANIRFMAKADSNNEDGGVDNVSILGIAPVQGVETWTASSEHVTIIYPTTFWPSDDPLVPVRWDITHCAPLFTVPDSEIKLYFGSVETEASVAGGFLRFTYRTDELLESAAAGEVTYVFPGIEGIVNLYDAVSVSGTLTNISAYLHFRGNSTANFFVGSELIFNVSVNDSEAEVYLDENNFTGLNFSNYTNKTVPIRLQVFNESISLVYGGNADIILITDRSGSMDWQMDSTSTGTSLTNCNETSLNNPNAKRIDVAACLDWNFTGTMIPNNTATNREWLVTFNTATSVNPPTWSSTLTSNRTYLNNSINTLYWIGAPNGNTCICCALKQAYDILVAESNPTRAKFVVLMTDGEATAGCADWTNPSRTVCPGVTLNDYMQDAINASRMLAGINATVYAVGMSVTGNTQAICTLQQVANNSAPYNGSYYVSSNASELLGIYEEIGRSIVSGVDYVNQGVSAISGDIPPSTLYPDSYINITYQSITETPSPTEISVVLQTDPFDDCVTNFTLPGGIRYIDARVTSYSGPLWTRVLAINNVTIYNLSDYGSNLSILGDPYSISIPPNVLRQGANNITLFIGNDSSGSCSGNNTLIFTALVNASTSRSIVVPKAEGCSWYVEFEDGTFATNVIPGNYTGSNTCSYTSSNHTQAQGAYDGLDAYQVAIYNLFKQLDFDNNGKVLVNLQQFDLEIYINLVSQVPYLWGPSILQVDVWR